MYTVTLLYCILSRHSYTRPCTNLCLFFTCTDAPTSIKCPKCPVASAKALYALRSRLRRRGIAPLSCFSSCASNATALTIVSVFPFFRACFRNLCDSLARTQRVGVMPRAAIDCGTVQVSFGASSVSRSSSRLSRSEEVSSNNMIRSAVVAFMVFLTAEGARASVKAGR